MLVAATEITGPAGAIEALLVAGASLVVAGLMLAAVLRRRRSPRGRPGQPPATVHSTGEPQRTGSQALASAVAASPPPTREAPHPAGDSPAAVGPRPAPDSPAADPRVRPEPGPRQLSDGAVAGLGRALERSRRLRAAEEQMAYELGELAGGHWLVERYVLLGSRRVPFVIAGPTGVFLMGVTDGAWDVRDLVALSRLKAVAEELLPGYRGDVHAGVCMVFDRMEPRTWHGGLDVEGHGGWVLGLDWLMRWLHSFDSEHGPDTGDIAALATAAAPVWRRRATARLPVVRNFG